MNYKRGDVCSFLLPFQVEKGSEFTHTSIVKPTGSFYIPAEKIDDFHRLYKSAVHFGEDLYLTEKHRDISPILIDFDFRFQKVDHVERCFGEELINTIVHTYARIIRDYVDMPSFTMIVMLKPSPVVNKDVIKDGIHIVVPDVVTRPSVQYLIREKVLAECSQMLSSLELVNSYEDVIDEAVIQRNNWQMYGSKKPNNEKYKVTDVFTISGNNNDVSKTPLNENEKDLDYVEWLSIRNKYDVSPLRENVMEEVKKLEDKLEEKKNKKITPANNMLQATQNLKKNMYEEDLDYVKNLVKILNPSRANRYDEWIKVGWCLRNIDYRLMNAWIDFSKQSSKFVDGECERLWNYMQDDGLGIGSLHMWAKQDNMQAYKEIIKSNIYCLIKKSLTETHHDIACVVHALYKHDFVCVSIKQNCWYEFRNHRWVLCESGHVLRSKISTSVYKEYVNYSQYLCQQTNMTDDEDEQKRLGDIRKKISSIELKLKNSTFKENIMKECRELFFVEKFEEKLDSKVNLIGFENGVYDLETLEFREGRPEDYVSFTTGINYISYDPEDKLAKDVNDFISKVLTKQHIKEYVMLLLASFLNGGIREERFHIWTGSGCFAKGTPVLMVDGKIKSVEDVKVGEKLMGDDGTPRQVQELFRGFSDMYRIVPLVGREETFEVNGQHDLVVKALDYFTLQKRGWKKYVASWLEHGEADGEIKHVNQTYSMWADANQALMNAKASPDSIKEGDILKMTVHQYLAVPRPVRKVFVLWRPDQPVDFPSSPLSFDPYTWGATVNPYLDIVPPELKENTMDVRMNVLAGIIDRIGVYYPGSNQVDIHAYSETLIDDVVWMARSLGIACFKKILEKRTPNKKKVLDRMYQTTLLGGQMLHEIPVRDPKKKPQAPRKYAKDYSLIPFKLYQIKDDEFYGFELDGNRRFLLGNFTVQKNSNGKSKTIDLFEQSFGDYCCKLPITLLTQKRAASNAATSELARTKGKRFACLQEPSEDEKLNVGLMKELTGGDKIQARLIYKEPIEFKPQFKMILTCNSLPNVPSDDGGTWRRIRVVEFTSKFCENPNPEKETEFQADFELSDKFPLWREHFMSLLIEYYKKYMDVGITEPDEVLQCTREYQKNNDVFLEFVEQECEKCDSEFLSYTDVFSSFKMWCRDNNIQPPTLSKKVFAKSVIKTLGKMVNINKVDGWKGWRFKVDGNVKDDDL
jgi:P4 family phage/plasmid primase-like protien